MCCARSVARSRTSGAGWTTRSVRLPMPKPPSSRDNPRIRRPSDELSRSSRRRTTAKPCGGTTPTRSWRNSNGAAGRWRLLFKDVEAVLDEDPAGPTAQALLDRWDGLVHEFTRGHAEIAQGVAR